MRPPRLAIIGLDGAVPSLVMALAQEGRLPAINRLLQSGVWFSDCRPAFPSITPTCWASLSTGTMPYTHGAVDQDIHLPGTELDTVVSAYHGDNIHAERLWEAAARVGKRSLVMQMPTTGPARSDMVFQIAGAGCAAIGGASPSAPTVPGSYLVKERLFDTNADSPMLWDDTPPGAEAKAVLSVDSEGAEPSIEDFCWVAEVGEGRVTLRPGSGAEGGAVLLEAGHWSSATDIELRSADGPIRVRYRAKLIRASGKGRDLSLFISAMGDVRKTASPTEFAERISEIPGLPASHGHALFLNSFDDAVSYLDAESMNFDWQYDVIRDTLERDAVDIVAVYSVYLDSMNHRYRNIVENLADVTESHRRKVITDYDHGYELADSFVGRIAELFGDDTTYVIASDHGSVGYTSIINPFEVLERGGLLTYKRADDVTGRQVDWSRTAAYPVGSCHVYVNLEGRDPSGSVAPDDYANTVHQIIRVLQHGFWDKKAGRSALALAVPNEQAGIVGLGGPLCGDVVYGLAGGHIGGYVGGVHACQIPTAKTATGDIRSTLLISGPGFRKGLVCSAPVHLWDIAPTLSHVLGYPQLQNADGKIIQQSLL